MFRETLPLGDESIFNPPAIVGKPGNCPLHHSPRFGRALVLNITGQLLPPLFRPHR